jgi:glycine C-acetyltransferase
VRFATEHVPMCHCGVNCVICCCSQIINSTLGKALGGATGGYTAGPKPVIDLLRQKSRPYLFSNAVTPSVVCTPCFWLSAPRSSS